MKSILDIEVNGGMLDLGEANLRYEMVNSSFITELYQGDYSFPFTIPATPPNLKTFGFANYLDVSERALEYTVTLYLFGMPKFTSKLRVTKGRRRSLDIVINGGIKGLINASKKLSEIDLGEDYNLGNNQGAILNIAKLAAECGDWSQYGFTFVPFYAPNFYNNLNADFLGVVNRVNSTTGAILGNALTPINNKYTMVPWIFQKWILNKIFQAEGLTPSGSYWDDPEISKLLLFNNQAIEVRPKGYNTKVRRIEDHDLTTDTQHMEFFVGPAGTYDNVSGWDDTTFQYTFKNAGRYAISLRFDAKVESTSLIPPPTMKAGKIHVVFNGIYVQATVNIKETGKGFPPFYPGYDTVTEEYFVSFYKDIFVGDVGKTLHVEFQKDNGTFQAGTFLKVRSGCTLDIVLDESSMPAAEPQAISFKKHVPDMTVAEFLGQIKKDGVVYNFDFATSKVKLEMIDKTLDLDDAIDMSGKTEPDYELVLEDANKGVKIEYEFQSEEKAGMAIPADKLVGFTDISIISEIPMPVEEGTFMVLNTTHQVLRAAKNSGTGDLEWQQAGHYYPPFVIGNGESSLKSKLGPMFMCVSTNEGGSADENYALMPQYNGAGSSSLYGLGVNPFEPRRAFWRGYNQAGSVANPRLGKYIVASPGRIGLNHNVMGEFSFRLDKDTGIVRKNSERFFTAMSRSECVEATMCLEPKDFEKIHSASKFYFDFNRFLAKSISISFTRTRAVAKAIMLKL